MGEVGGATQHGHRQPGVLNYSTGFGPPLGVGQIADAGVHFQAVDIELGGHLDPLPESHRLTGQDHVIEVRFWEGG